MTTTLAEPLSVFVASMLLFQRAARREIAAGEITGVTPEARSAARMLHLVYGHDITLVARQLAVSRALAQRLVGRAVMMRRAGRG